MDRGLELRNHKEITPTLTAPGTVRTAAGGDLRSKRLSGVQQEDNTIS